jgi:hypothetical protein
MIKGETIFDIPLIGEGVGSRIEKVSGVKKIRKLLHNHSAHLRVVHVRKAEDFVSPSDSLETKLQDKDGETRGESEAARGTEEVPDSVRMKAASMSPHGAALFFVPKPSGRGLRAVSDYRQINKITTKILPSLPLVENILTQMEGAQFFSGLDLTSFFYQIHVEPDDVPLTAMRTIFGMYQFKVCPMMTGSVGTAMANMESILSHVISLPGETLPANPRVVPPLPEQPGFTADESWKLLQYHSVLGSYCCVFIDDILRPTSSSVASGSPILSKLAWYNKSLLAAS